MNKDLVENRTEPTGRREIKYEYTTRFPEILRRLNAAIVLTTYQAGKLLVIGVHNNQIQLAYRNYEQPMGLAVAPNRMAVGTRREIRFFSSIPSGLRDQSGDLAGQNSLVERGSQVTGKIQGHDLAFGSEELWIVNTLFSCLCTLHHDFSFVPRWKPRFISAIAAEDRCHLNGMAMQDGQPRLVTALAATDTEEGWRANRAGSGILIDVHSGEIVVQGLAMPHSPRVHEGKWYVLNSGLGSLGTIDASSGTYTEIERSPGYTRGLAMIGQIAIVGLSKIRESTVFGGLPIASMHQELFCGVGMIDLDSGKTVAILKFTEGIDEIFSVEFLPGSTLPQFAGTMSHDVENEIWVVPETSI